MHCMHTDCYLYTANNTSEPETCSNVGLMLPHLLQHWHDCNPAFDQCLIILCLLRCRCSVGLTCRGVNSESTLGERFVFAVTGLEIKLFGWVPTGHSLTKFWVPAQNFGCPIFLNNTNNQDFFSTILIHY